MRVLLFIVITLYGVYSINILPTTKLKADYQTLQSASEIAKSVFLAKPQPYCTIALLLDSSSSTPTGIAKSLSDELITLNYGMFEVLHISGINLTEITMEETLQQVRKMRQNSWCLTLLVMSEELTFLTSFAENAMRSRVLVETTRLLVITKLPLQHLQLLMRHHWTYAMMTSMMMNCEDDSENARYGIYVNLPYTNVGPKVVRTATWTQTVGLTYLTSQALFPRKFNNFHKKQVNVTALPFPPYWNAFDVKGPNGTVVKKYTGTDYLMIDAIAKALNFTVHVLQTANWNEVTKKVQERESFIATIIYAVFPKRLEQYDYSYMFEYAFHAFTMAKPAIKPQWQSLYYPLTDGVWLFILVVVFLMPLPFILVSNGSRYETNIQKNSPIQAGTLLQDIIGTLFGQGISNRLPDSYSCRLLFGSWLIFAFIIGTAYRGNLTASLTAPKYPARVETLQQLVSVGARVTMPPYGAHFRDFFKESDSSDFKTLGERVDIVSTAFNGVQKASKKRQAHMEARRYLELLIAEKFTEADGSTGLYIGRESVFPGLSAWPIPHDAPFKSVLDRTIMGVIEGGLYEKWSRDLINEARQESSRKKREKLQQRIAEGLEPLESSAVDGSGTMALTVIHMQGPLLLLLLGLMSAGMIFGVEVLSLWCFSEKKNK